MEEVNPADPGRYRTPDGWGKAFETRRSIIDVKDAPPITVTLRRTDNGPVLPEDAGHDVGSVTPPGHVATLGWTALDPADTSMTSAIWSMQASSIAEGIAAGEGFVAPAQNVTMADQSGIALVMFRSIPARDPASLGQGRLPALGWMPENRWLGRQPYADNPRFVNRGRDCRQHQQQDHRPPLPAPRELHLGRHAAGAALGPADAGT